MGAGTKFPNGIGADDSNYIDTDGLVVETITRTGGDLTLAVTLTDANTTILAENSGKLHLMPNVSADRTFTLPTAAAGLFYEFQHTMEAADGHDWIIIAENAANFLKGGMVFVDSDAADSVTSAPDGSTDHTLQVNLPSTGTFVKLYCDGTNWFLTGSVFSTTAPSYT